SAGQGVDDAVDHLLDKHLVVTLAHDADHRLGPARPPAQPAMPVETGVRVLDGVAHLGALERLAAPVTYVLEHLRKRIEAVGDARHPVLQVLYHRPKPPRGGPATP